MYRYTSILLVASVIQAVCVSSTFAADGDPCELTVRENFLHDITEEHAVLADGSFAASVPNYSQGALITASSCGINSAMMLIGYWDANGWPCLVRNSPPFYQAYYYVDSAGNMQSETKYPDFLETLEYTLEDHVTFRESTGGTGAVNYPEEVVESIQALNTDTGDWSGDNQRDEDRHPAWITAEIDAGRPVLYHVKSADASLVWVDDTGVSSTDWHVMPIIGYIETQSGIEVAGSCQGVGSSTFEWAGRSSWRDGGNSYVWITDNDTRRIVNKIVPGGTSTCQDRMDQDEDGFLASVNESRLQGLTSYTDCNDADPTIFPGAIETCGTEDRDCDGNAENGRPDLDGDNIMDDCDDDIDGDGIDNTSDNCGVAELDCSRDFDNDQHADYFDNCQHEYNPDQADCDHNSIGNACDSETPEPCVELLSITDNASFDPNLDHKFFTVTYKTWGFAEHGVDHMTAHWCGGCSTVNDDPAAPYFRTTEHCLDWYSLCTADRWDRVNWANCQGSEPTDWADHLRCPSIPFDGDDGTLKTFHWTQGTNLTDQYMAVNDVSSPELSSGVQAFFRLRLRPEGHSTAAVQNVTLTGPPAVSGNRARMLFHQMRQAEEARYMMAPSFIDEMEKQFNVPYPDPGPYGGR